MSMPSRREVLLGVASLTAGLAVGGCNATPDNEPRPDEGRIASDKADVVTTPSSDLPFSLDGVPCEGNVIQAARGEVEATLADEWTFGGDYAQIGSFPIDEKTVFGSATQTPDDVTSYAAALITPNGYDLLEEPQLEEPCYEPQDGTGTADLLVWRCAELLNVPSAGTDNWQLRAWDAASGKVRTICSAEDLNGTRQTPLLDAEVVPVTDGANAYFATNLLSDGTWVPSVICCNLDGTEQPVVIGSGAYPAVVEDGALWAALNDDGSALCTALKHWNGKENRNVFTLDPDNSWGISGVWACGGTHAVALSATDSAQGSYVGVWRGNFETLVCWIATDAPRVIASLNQSWFVWGAGSESHNTEMFALNLGTCEATYLGDAPGYSRPTVAQECDAIMVPVTHGTAAVSFRVGTLS